MPPACYSPLLPITAHGHPLPWLPYLCVGWRVGAHCRITPGFPPACPPVQHSEKGLTMPKARSVGRSLSTPHPANPGLHSARSGLLISPLSPNGPTASLQAGDCPKPPVPPRFSPQPPERWHLPTAAPSALLVSPPSKPNQPPTTNIWRGGGSWMWVCFASQAPARRSQHEPG